MNNTKLITYFSDNEKSTVISNEQYIGLREAINRGDRFIEIDGQMQNIADMKSVESYGAEKPLELWGSDTRRYISAPNEKPFWSVIFFENAKRLKNHRFFIWNDTICKYRKATGIDDPMELINYIDKHPPETQNKDYATC